MVSRIEVFRTPLGGDKFFSCESPKEVSSPVSKKQRHAEEKKCVEDYPIKEKSKVERVLGCLQEIAGPHDKSEKEVIELCKQYQIDEDVLKLYAQASRYVIRKLDPLKTVEAVFKIKEIKSRLKYRYSQVDQNGLAKWIQSLLSGPEADWAVVKKIATPTKTRIVGFTNTSYECSVASLPQASPTKKAPSENEVVLERVFECVECVFGAGNKNDKEIEELCQTYQVDREVLERCIRAVRYVIRKTELEGGLSDATVHKVFCSSLTLRHLQNNFFGIDPYFLKEWMEELLKGTDADRAILKKISAPPKKRRK